MFKVTHDDMLKRVIELKFDTWDKILDDDGIIIKIYRPSTLSKRFKDYNVDKNFQIWLKEKSGEFKPNHLRVMIDLNLRARTRPELKKQLLMAFDNIYYGEDPDEAIKPLRNEIFAQYLNSLRVIAYLDQLFMIEQEYGYNKKSKFEPATLFYQGWIREFIDNNKEIDNLTMSVCSFRPPTAKYVSKENKKNRKYEDNLSSLWYLE